MNGNVANFVETEQIFRAKRGDVFSFVQIRGSIPLYWTQLDKWKLKPAIITEKNLTKHYQPLKSHLFSLYNDYINEKTNKTKVDIVIVNLIDKKGTQELLGTCLSNALDEISIKTSSSNQIVHSIDRNHVTTDRHDIPLVNTSTPVIVEHVWFDYHMKCAGGKTSAIGELIPVLDPTITGKEGYFHIGIALLFLSLFFIRPFTYALPFLSLYLPLFSFFPLLFFLHPFNNLQGLLY